MKGYLRKWKKTEIPFMLALFIDMLEIPSILSRSFLADIIDPVYAFGCLSKAKERFDLFDSKEFDKLPHVKDVLRQITVNENDEQVYQNILLSNYEAAKQRISEKKVRLSEKVRTCITERLEEESDSKGIFQYVQQLLNTEGWLRTNEEGEIDFEFGDEGLTYLYKHFSIPLMNAGVKASVPDLLNQWHGLLQYAREYLCVTSTPYRVCWRRIFNSPRCSAWSDVLILIELLFTIPISNAKLERMFSKLNQVKTLQRGSLQQIRLEYLLRIAEEGPAVERYDVTPAMKIWANEKVRRPKQTERKQYEKRESKKRKLSSLSDSDSDDNQKTAIDLFDDQVFHLVLLQQFVYFIVTFYCRNNHFGGF